jgi:hypothetical protein
MKKFLGCILFALLAPPCAQAGTGYYLVTTYPVEHQKSIDFKYWKAWPTQGETSSSPEIGYGYNVNSRWYTEVTAAWYQYGTQSQKLAALEWQNDVMLTQGQLPFDVAFHTNIERYADGDHEVELQFGPVFQTEVGRTQLNFNVFFNHAYRVEKAEPTEISYQWQVRYHYTEKLQFGAQGFGEMGEWNHWLPREQQSHRAGPALFGTWRLGGTSELKYEAALLIGTNSAVRAKSFATRIQYAF